MGAPVVPAATAAEIAASQAQSLLAAQAGKGGKSAKPSTIDFGEVIERLSSPLKMLTGSLTDLGDTFDKVKNVVTETVGAFRPIALLQFNRALLDLQGTVGSVLLPIMNQMTDTVRSLADYFYNLPPSFKDVARSAIDGIVVFGGLAAAIGIVSSVLLAMPFARVGQALQWLWNTFEGTAGGMRAVNSALNLIESAFEGLIQVFDLAWAATSGVREELSMAFDSLGNALSDLFEALKPGLAFNFGILAAALTGAIAFLSRVFELLTFMIEGVANAITGIIESLNGVLFGGIGGLKLPDVSKREKGSSFGMGFGGGGVKSPESLYNEITNQIIQNSRSAGPAEQTASATERIANAVETFSGPLSAALAIYNTLTQAGQGASNGADGSGGIGGPVAAGGVSGAIQDFIDGLLRMK